MNIERLKRFVSLVNKKKALKAELTDLEVEIAMLEGGILDDFMKAGMTNTTIDGRTLYINKISYAKRCEGVSGAQAVAAMEEAGLDEFTTLNTQSFSSELRRWEEDGVEMPKELDGIIEFNPTFSIRSRKKS